MIKTKILLLITLAIIASFLLYCWAIILTTEVLATWRHYAGLILFVPLVFLFFLDVRKAILATGTYLLLGTFNALAITPAITTSWIGNDSIHTPPVQLLFLGIFILYFILNFKSLIDIYLDYKETKVHRGKSLCSEFADLMQSNGQYLSLFLFELTRLKAYPIS